MKTEGQLIKAALGDKWQNLSPKTQARFEIDPTHEIPKEYVGEMTEVGCSWVGALLANMTRLIGAPLIPYSEKNVPIDVTVFKKPENPAIYKKRTYRFKNHKPFTVLSWMKLGAKGQFQEFVGFGLGMNMILDAKDQKLCFLGQGYFLEIFGFCIPIPFFLSPGKALIIHSDHGDNAFRVRIEMRHPWFGLMYMQDGVFRDK